MEQDYTQDLVNCQNCKRIKKHANLLDCFHNICQDCEQENENITCQSCPQNPQIPREGLNHQLNALLYEHLTDQDLVDPDAKKCTMCGKLEDTVYCVNCGTFWCEFGVEELHNTIIARGHTHVLKRAMTQFDFHLMPKGEGDYDDEGEWDRMLEEFENMENEGREHQTHIMQERNSLEDWKNEQENVVGNIFDRIMEQVMEGKKKFIRDLNRKCHKMHQKLEENMNQNENKLITLKRAYQLVTKMKFHKITSEQMKEFLIDRKIIQNTRTSCMKGLIKHVDKEALSKVEGLNIAADITIVIPSLKHSHISLPDSGKVNEPITINVCLKDSHDKIIKGNPNYPVYVQVTKNGKEEEVKRVNSDPNEFDDHTARFCASQSGTYEVRLKISGQVKETGEKTHITGRAVLTESITPVIESIREQGLHRAITAAADNYLYCVVKEPQEIRKYEISPDSQQVSLYLETSFGQGQLGSPCGICYVDAHLYVVDAGLNCVHIFTNNGEYIQKFGRTGQELGQFQRPMGIDHDCVRKEILIADTFNNRIQFCNTLDMKVFHCFGTNEHFKLKDPVDVKACKNGNTVVTTLKAQILLYDIERNLSRVLFCEILTPRHCCIDSDDNIYVTSHLGHSVYKLVQTEGGINAFEKIKLKTHPEFRFPTGVAMNRKGQLYVISRELNPESSQSFISVW